MCRRSISTRAVGDIEASHRVRSRRHCLSKAGTLRGRFPGYRDCLSDGDTFDIKTDAKTISIRLCGVDSPELSQPGYGAAAGALSNLTKANRFIAFKSAWERHAMGDQSERVATALSLNASSAIRISQPKWFA